MRGIAVKLTAALGTALGVFTAVATLASCSLGGDTGNGRAETVETGTASISSGGKTERVSVDSKGR